MTRGAGAAAPAAMSIDELAASSGVSSRTIRFYQSAGVLMPPRRSGRVALYDAEHLARLELVAMLQERGLRLSAIADLLRTGDPQTMSMSAWLGLGERLASVWAEEAPQVCDRATLEGLLEGTGAGIPEMERLGLATANAGGTWLVRSRRLLEVTAGLARAGVTPETSAVAAAILRRHLAAASDDLVTHFGEQLGRGVGRAANPAELGRALEALRPHAEQAMRVIFAQEVARRLARFAAPVA